MPVATPEARQESAELIHDRNADGQGRLFEPS